MLTFSIETNYTIVFQVFKLYTSCSIYFLQLTIFTYYYVSEIYLCWSCRYFLFFQYV